MSGSLHPTAIHRRQRRREKRSRLRAQLAAAPAVGRAAIDAKLQKTYAFGFAQSSAKKVHAAPAAPAAPAPVVSEAPAVPAASI